MQDINWKPTVSMTQRQSMKTAGICIDNNNAKVKGKIEKQRQRNIIQIMSIKQSSKRQ